MIAFTIAFKNDNVILLEDYSRYGNYKSITNSAGDIVHYLQKEGILYGQKLMYIDSDDVIDEIVYSEGKDYIFRTFKPWGIRSIGHFCQRFGIPIGRLCMKAEPKYYYER